MDITIEILINEDQPLTTVSHNDYASWETEYKWEFSTQVYVL